jgi:hypothetical protein
VRITQSKFDLNFAIRSGGAVYSKAGARLVLTGSSFTGNVALSGGLIWLAEQQGAFPVLRSNKGRLNTALRGALVFTDSTSRLARFNESGFFNDSLVADPYRLGLFFPFNVAVQGYGVVASPARRMFFNISGSSSSSGSSGERDPRVIRVAMGNRLKDVSLRVVDAYNQSVLWSPESQQFRFSVSGGGSAPQQQQPELVGSTSETLPPEGFVSLHNLRVNVKEPGTYKLSAHSAQLGVLNVTLVVTRCEAATGLATVSDIKSCEPCGPGLVNEFENLQACHRCKSGKQGSFASSDRMHW